VIVRRSIALVIAGAAALASSPAAIASLPRAHVQVSPARGWPGTTFVLSFVARSATGTTGSTVCATC
jgi:hypothetical protein